MSQQINLYNPLFLKKKKYFSTLTMAQGLGLIILGMALMYAYAWHQLSTVQQRAAEVERRLAAEQQRLAKYSAEYSAPRRNEALQEEIRKIEAVLQSREEVEQLLRGGALGDTRGFSPFMTAFARQSVDGLWLTGFSISAAGAEIAIEGRTLSADLVPIYIRRLGAEQVMRGRTFAALQVQQPLVEGAKGVPTQPAKAEAGPRYLEFSLRSRLPEKRK